MKRKTRRILTVLFAAVFVISAGYLAWYYIDSAVQKGRYEELSQLHQSVTPRPSIVPEQTQPVTEPDTQPDTGILPEFAPLYEKNPDIVGWLTVPGTVIDYPVMQTKDRPNYYLRRNFDGKKHNAGCLYAAEICDVFTPSDNITIYGHRMKNGSMFAALENFMDEDYCRENPYLYFDTLESLHTYQVLAVFLTTSSVGEGFAYHEFANAENRQAFDTFVDTCKSLSLYDTGVDAGYGDKLITLSTCDYSLVNGRLVVVAKRVA